MDAIDWPAHLETHRRSGLSAQAYAREHGLVYHQLLYRINRAKELSVPTCEGFVPVSVAGARGPGQCVGTVEFPGGTRMVVHDAAVLVSLAQLLAGRV